jgi:hypothetical protein
MLRGDQADLSLSKLTESRRAAPSKKQRHSKILAEPPKTATRRAAHRDRDMPQLYRMLGITTVCMAKRIASRLLVAPRKTTASSHIASASASAAARCWHTVAHSRRALLCAELSDLCLKSAGTELALRAAALLVHLAQSLFLRRRDAPGEVRVLKLMKGCGKARCPCGSCSVRDRIS